MGSLVKVGFGIRSDSASSSSSACSVVAQLGVITVMIDGCRLFASAIREGGFSRRGFGLGHPVIGVARPSRLQARCL